MNRSLRTQVASLSLAAMVTLASIILGYPAAQAVARVSPKWRGLVVGMMILPAAAARFWVRDLKPLLAAAVGISAIGSVLGLVLSYHLDAPSGPCIVLTLGGLYLLSIVFGPRGALRARRVPAHHLKA